MPRVLSALPVLLALAAAPLAAQATIDPGMTKAQVVERLGAPAHESARGPHTYLFYRNGVERRVGMHDVVILRDDQVVDAVFRSERRRYGGESSSPRAIPPAEAARGTPTVRKTPQ
jgi:hypothetical protein